MEQPEYFRSIKDGMTMERNLTSQEAAVYEGTDILVIKQKCFYEKNYVKDYQPAK